MKENKTTIRDTFFIATHPRLAASTFVRRIYVGIGHEFPPHTATIEDFADNLSLTEAMKRVQQAQRKN